MMPTVLICGRPTQALLNLLATMAHELVIIHPGSMRGRHANLIIVDETRISAEATMTLAALPIHSVPDLSNLEYDEPLRDRPQWRRPVDIRVRQPIIPRRRRHDRSGSRK